MLNTTENAVLIKQISRENMMLGLCTLDIISNSCFSTVRQVINLDLGIGIDILIVIHDCRYLKVLCPLIFML